MVQSRAPQSLTGRVAADQDFYPAVIHALKDHGIQALHIEVCSQTKPGYPGGGEIPIPVVRIIVDAQRGNPLQSWSAGRRDLMALLDRKGYPGDVQVEIVDPDRHYQPSLFPVHHKNPAVAAYKAMRHTLLARIRAAIEPHWAVLSLFNIGRTSNLMKPTVVLMVNPLATHDWSILRASLESIIHQHNSRIGLEIMPGRFRKSPPNDPSRQGISFWDDMDAPLRHGMSIGVDGETGGGTLGGFFHMRSPTKVHKGFLTNSHVVAPPSSASEAEIREYDFFGLPYNSSPNNAGRTWIQYFAKKDCDATSSHGRMEVEAVRAAIDTEREQEGQREERGIATDQTRAAFHFRLQRLRQRLASARQTLARADRLPTLLGRTVLASGRQVTPNMKTLDYAFVETSKTYNMEFPSPAIFNALKARPSDHGLKLTLLLPPKPDSFSKIQPSTYYFKNGRTTGLTSGICNGVEAWTKPTETHTLFDARGRVVKIHKAGRKFKLDDNGRLIYDPVDHTPVEEPDEVWYAPEWVILNATIDAGQISKQKDFSDLEDSGSLLYDHMGNNGGLLWGTLEGFCGPLVDEARCVGAGMVTDIEEVRLAMKVALGWPQDADVECLEFP
ncbi:MAG: hypothetical protein Q9219_002667 [cf. Caloplaca sp. 3 TL-2023]